MSNTKESNSSEGTTEDDAAAMQKAFQEYMLSSSSNKKNKKKTNQTAGRPPTTPSPHRKSESSSNTNASASGKKTKSGSKNKIPITIAPIRTPSPPTRNNTRGPPAQRTSPQYSSSNSSSPSSSPRHQYYSQQLQQDWDGALQSFQSCLQTWLDLDDQLLTIWNAVVGLRQAIQYAAQRLQDSPSMASETKQHRMAWKNCGYRGGGGGRRTTTLNGTTTTTTRTRGLQLQRSDVDLALDYSVLQQEDLLRTARQFLHSLSQEQDALGRRLDSMLRLWYPDVVVVAMTAATASSYAGADSDHSDEMENDDVDQADDYDNDAVGLVTIQNRRRRQMEWAQAIYTATAQELWRKQQWAEMVWNSVTDPLLLSPSTVSPNEEEKVEEEEVSGLEPPPSKSSPIKIARRCAEQWSRRHPSSCLYGLRFDEYE